MTGFFEPGFEYDDATPYTAPEIIRTFRCVAVATLPGTDMPMAFGFMHTDSLGWSGTGMDLNHWRRGWNRGGTFGADIDTAAGRASDWLDAWERYYAALGLPQDALLIAGPPPSAEPRASATTLRSVLDALATTLVKHAEAQASLGEALDLLGARPHGSPHIIEVTAGTDQFSPDAILHAVHHPLKCHRLPYGEYCDFDSAVARHKLDFPNEAGRYEARVEDWDTGTGLMLERLDAEAGA